MRYLYKGQIFESENIDGKLYYHASPRKFSAFNPNLKAFWFGDSPECVACEGKYIYTVKLNLGRSYYWKIGDAEPDDIEFINRLLNSGYNSCIAPSNICNTDYIVYDPTRIEIISIIRHNDEC